MKKRHLKKGSTVKNIHLLKNLFEESLNLVYFLVLQYIQQQLPIEEAVETSHVTKTFEEQIEQRLEPL